MVVLDKYGHHGGVNGGGDQGTKNDQNGATKKAVPTISANITENAVSPKTATLDDFLRKLGAWHMPIFAFGFSRGIPLTMLMMFTVFSAPVRQNYWCASRVPENATLVEADAVNACDGSCTSFKFDRQVYGYTIMEHFNLVCDRSWLSSFSQSLYLGGIMVGGILHAHISDWWGRKAVIAISIVWTLIASAATAFAPTIELFIVGRVLTACGAVGFAEAAFTLVVETVSPQQRYMPSLTIGTGWSTGMLILPLAAWLLRDWRLLQLFVAATTLPLFGLWFLVPESPRWQLSTGHFDAAETNLKKLVKHNPKFTEDHVIQLVDDRRNELANSNGGKVPKRPSAMTVLKKPYLTSSMVFCFCMSVSSMAWYYLTVSTTTVASGNPYLGYALAALAEYPAKLVNSIFIKWVPRKTTMFTSFFSSSVVLLGVVLLPKEHSWAKLGLVIIGKVCTSVNMSVARVAVSETYPTVIRAMALSVLATIGRIGSCIAPFFEEFERHSSMDFLPTAVVAVLCLLASLSTQLLNETFEHTLPDNLQKNTCTQAEARQENGSNATR